MGKEVKTMYEELVGRLRAWEKADVSNWRTFKDAADAIEDLTAQLDQATEYLKNNADAIEELNDRNVGKWIPVTERLPEKEDEAVIVWEKQGFALIDWRHDNKWAILDNNYGIATHWMPLPEPPKEE